MDEQVVVAHLGGNVKRWPLGGSFALCLVAALLCLCQTGCVERRLVIRSNPPGALVFVDDYEIGITPVATDFVYYGTRKIRLVKDGYETLTVLQPIPSPWYEVSPIDFVSENLVPNEIRDVRAVDYQLTPQVIVPSQQLLGRAEELRRSNQTPPVLVPNGMPAPAFTPPPSGAAPLLPTGSPPSAVPGQPTMQPVY